MQGFFVPNPMSMSSLKIPVKKGGRLSFSLAVEKKLGEKST
jgi:hypothetical protein